MKKNYKHNSDLCKVWNLFHKKVGVHLPMILDQMNAKDSFKTILSAVAMQCNLCKLKQSRKDVTWEILVEALCDL